MNSYESFITTKEVMIATTGFKPYSISPVLFDFQTAITDWAIKKGRSAVWAGTGLGKSFIQLEWANNVFKHTGKPVLILAPMAIPAQTKKEGVKIGIDVNICQSQNDVIPGINITNYEKLHKFDPSSFVGVVLEECFAWDTPIDVFNIDNSLECKYIKDVESGDKILNASGVDYVDKIYKRQVYRAIQVNFNGRVITCSENHPFFTVYGWKCAQDLQPGDNIMATSKAVCMVRGDIQTEICSEQKSQVLREILLSEMENEHSRALCESAYFSGGKEEGDIEVKMAEEWAPESIERDREDIKSKTNVEPRDKTKSECYIATDKAQTFKAWGKWSRDDIAAAHNDGCNIRQLDCGICYITGKTETRFSNMLQGRLGESRSKNSNRGGRTHTSVSEGFRPEERQHVGFFRVESIKVLELGHPDMERYRDEDGNVYFYDIKAKRHPSFSVNGCLVHNSSILKNFAGATKQQLIESFKDTHYKLCCSATPSPNDFTEYGNHAEFLNVCTRAEMLATYFIHDSGCTQKWRLKGHAETAFFEWVSKWAIMIEKPSDIGFDDEKMILPPLNVFEHIVPAIPAPGEMFVVPASTLGERRKARRDSLESRCQLAADISNIC